MARQEVSRTTHIEEGELRVTHENAILTNITISVLQTKLPFGVCNGVSAFQRVIDNMIEKYNLKNTYAYIDDITVTGINQTDHDANLKALLEAAKANGFTGFDRKIIKSNLIQPDFGHF